MAGHETTVRLLLQHGANPNLEEYGITPLIAASQFGHKGVAKILIKEGRAIVNDGRSLGCGALHAALSNREGEMADFLLEEGASLGGYGLDNSPSTDQLHNASRITVQGQSQTLTQRQIDQGAKPDTSDILYGTLLQAAAAAGAEAIVKLLVQTGAKADSPEKFRGGSPIMAAASIGHARIVEFLIDKGANAHSARGYYGNLL